MKPMPANDLQEALKTIREAVYGDNLIWGTHRLTNRRVGETMPIADPTEDTDAGRAEFARLLVWAHSQEWVRAIYFYPPVPNAATEANISTSTGVFSKSGKTLQEAFVRALAAAIRARAGGGGE